MRKIFLAFAALAALGLTTGTAGASQLSKLKPTIQKKGKEAKVWWRDAVAFKPAAVNEVKAKTIKAIDNGTQHHMAKK